MKALSLTGDCTGLCSPSAPGPWPKRAVELVRRLLQGPQLVLSCLLPDAQVAETPEFTIILMDLAWVLTQFSLLLTDNLLNFLTCFMPSCKRLESSFVHYLHTHFHSLISSSCPLEKHMYIW